MLKTLLVGEDASAAETSFSGSHFLIYLDVKSHRLQESHWLCSSLVLSATRMTTDASKISAVTVEDISGHLMVKSPIIISLNKYFMVILLLYRNLAPFLFFLSQPWVIFYPSTLQLKITLNFN